MHRQPSTTDLSPHRNNHSSTAGSVAQLITAYNAKNAAPRGDGVIERIVRRDLDFLIVTHLGRPGNDLLSRVLRRSTIGSGAFHGRVRNGIGCSHPDIITRSAKERDNENWSSFYMPKWALLNESNQANRVISTGKLHTLQCFHTRPINEVVYLDSQGRTRFEVGFTLRCLQRLSRPHIATLLCRWRDNRSTRGVSIPVLSY